MSDRSTRGWTPLILRFGFLLSYWRTLGFLILASVIGGLLMWPAGLVSVWLSAGLYDLAFILVIGVLGVVTIRAVVRGFDKFFDVFDEPMEQRWKLYMSIRQRLEGKERAKDRRLAIQADFRELFESDVAYQEFRAGIQDILFSATWRKSEKGWLVAAVGFWAITTMLWYGVTGPLFFSYAGFIVIPWTQYHAIYAAIVNLILFLFMFSGLRLIYNYLSAIWLLDDSRRNLLIWQHIRRLQSNTDTESVEVPAEDEVSEYPFMSYTRFYFITSRIGRHIAWVTLALILLVILWVLRQAIPVELATFGTVSMLTIVFSILAIPGAIIFFLIPQREIHNLLLDTKDALLREWRKIYDAKVYTFFTVFQSQPKTNPGPANRTQIVTLRQDIDTLRNLILETSAEKTWTVSVSVAAGASGVSLIPTFFTMGQYWIALPP